MSILDVWRRGDLPGLAQEDAAPEQRDRAAMREAFLGPARGLPASRAARKARQWISNPWENNRFSEMDFNPLDFNNGFCENLFGPMGKHPSNHSDLCDCVVCVCVCVCASAYVE